MQTPKNSVLEVPSSSPRAHTRSASPTIQVPAKSPATLLHLDLCKKCCHQAKDPRALPCGHSYCFSCLDPENQCVVCPENTQTKPRRGSLKIPPVNWIASSPRSSEASEADDEPNEIFCDACENSQPNHATKWCPSCTSHYCDSCDGIAHTLKNLRSHYRAPIATKTSFPLCSKHNRNKEIYCKETDELVCLVCFFVESYNKTHTGIPFLEYSKSVRKDLKQTLAPISDKHYFEVQQKVLESQKGKIEEEIKALEAQVLSLKEQLLPILSEITKTEDLLEKVEICESVLEKAIDELEIVDLLDKSKVTKIKKTIQEILSEIPAYEPKKRTMVVKSASPMRLRRDVPNNSPERKTEICFSGEQKLGKIKEDYQVNKGTLFESGKHSWKIKCEEVVGPYDLGVVTSSHSTHFNVAGIPNTAWGIRTNGFILGNKNVVDKKAVFNQGDEVEFFLDLDLGKMTIVINGGHQVEIPDIVGPVHVAFSGQEGASARLM